MSASRLNGADAKRRVRRASGLRRGRTTTTVLPARPARQTARRLLAEVLGTFSLTFVAAGGAAIAAVSGGGLGGSAIAVAPGLLVTAMIYTIGPISGAHLNPVVTFAFAIRRNFPWRRVPGYWAAQLVGALLAALVLRGLFESAVEAGTTRPVGGIAPALAVEVILTALLVTVILATAANDRIVGHNAALAVGATIILAGLVGAPISGASMNPARSLGPALLIGPLRDVWIYLVGPMLGSLVAVGIAWLLRGPGSPHARQVATEEMADTSPAQPRPRQHRVAPHRQSAGPGGGLTAHRRGTSPGFRKPEERRAT